MSGAGAGASTAFERLGGDETLRTLTARLLAARTAAGHWEGYLASSALATATAVGALALADPRRHAEVVRDGIAWLAAHQNADGGWGDTTQSASNISTTALVWAACTLAEPSLDDNAGRERREDDLRDRLADATRRAESWLLDAVSVGTAGRVGAAARAAADTGAASGAGTAGRTADAPPAAREALSTEALSAEAIVAALARRYGNDRTFSVPILTVLAIAGKLGAGAEAWRRVPQLPFELAVCPHQWFQWVRLPVVSYALPALIAIGQVRHHHRPTRNPVTRLVRRATRARTLDTLRAIQPASGGYLEAVPLTAFVVMSLVSSAQSDHPVVRHGVRFLLHTRREDGSWPIDSNLATWVTTLSVNALAQQQRPRERRASVSGPRRLLNARDRVRLMSWLLAQQYRVEHPYTHAAPGGWAWTDLPGGVPDADDTPGALLALAHLSNAASWTTDDDGDRNSDRSSDGDRDGGRGSDGDRDVHGDADRLTESTVPDVATVRESAGLGVRWLVDLQNRDGGIPTFCRGWGALPFDRSSPDLTAHALLAWDMWRGGRVRDAFADRGYGAGAVTSASRNDVGRDDGAGLEGRVVRAMDRAVAFLIRVQRADGAWVPLWFGNERAPGEENPTYGTARVLIALAQLGDRRGPDCRALATRGAAWLLAAQNADGGWGGSAGIPSSLEETALAVDALSALAARDLDPSTSISTSASTSTSAIERGVAWLVQATARGTRTPASPIGLYFARLWYDERLYPLIFAVSALGRARGVLDRTRPDVPLAR